jgi:hypothetical protein
VEEEKAGERREQQGEAEVLWKRRHSQNSGALSSEIHCLRVQKAPFLSIYLGKITSLTKLYITF